MSLFGIEMSLFCVEVSLLGIEMSLVCIEMLLFCIEMSLFGVENSFWASVNLAQNESFAPPPPALLIKNRRLECESDANQLPNQDIVSLLACEREGRNCVTA